MSSGTASKLSGSTIKVGLAFANTGEEGDLYSSAGPTATAWAKWINGNGGIGGHPVQVIAIDTQSNPTTALATVKTLVGDGAVAVISADAVSEGATGPYLASQDVPILGIAYSPALSGLKNDYTSSTGTLGTSLLELAVAKQLGMTKFTSVYCSEAPSCAQAGAFYKGNSAAFDLKFAGALAVSASAPDYTSECLQAISSGTTFLQMDVDNATRGKVASTCQQQGYKGTFGALDEEINVPAMKQVPDATFAGALNSFPWWVNSPPVATFRSVMAQYASTTNYQNTAAESVWTALQLFSAALKGDKGAVTKTSVTTGLDGLKDETLGGLLPQPLSFSAGTVAAPITCGWTYTFKTSASEPTLLPVTGTSGNGVKGPLASTCPPPSVVTANEKAA